jgi:hypothetical protein
MSFKVSHNNTENAGMFALIVELVNGNKVVINIKANQLGWNT